MRAFFFFFRFVYKNEKKKVFQCIGVLCVPEGEIRAANDLHNLFCFSSVFEGHLYLYIPVCKRRGSKTILCDCLDC